MEILVAADMEGVTGVVHWDQVDPAHAEYARYRQLMTQDVNAAIRGALDAGASGAVVADGHHLGRNILIEELDARARLNSGGPSPFSMVQGIDETIGAAFFVGYHARVGSQNAILDHTWSSSCVAGLWLNGQPTGELGFNAAVCGHFGVPLILVTGDQTVCAEAAALVQGVEVAVVKQAIGRMAAECLPPEVSQGRIHEAARRAVSRLLAGQAPPAVRLSSPISVAVEVVQSEMADRAAALPGVRRTACKRLEFVADNALSAYRGFRALVSLARG